MIWNVPWLHFFLYFLHNTYRFISTRVFFFFCFCFLKNIFLELISFLLIFFIFEVLFPLIPWAHSSFLLWLQIAWAASTAGDNDSIIIREFIRQTIIIKNKRWWRPRWKKRDCQYFIEGWGPALCRRCQFSPDPAQRPRLWVAVPLVRRANRVKGQPQEKEKK